MARELLLNGKLQARDIINRLSDNGEDARRADEISAVLRDMLYKAYLQPSVLSQQTNPRDKEIGWSLRERQAIKGANLTASAERAIAETVRNRLSREEQQAWEGDAMGAGGIFGGGSGRLGLLVSNSRAAGIMPAAQEPNEAYRSRIASACPMSEASHKTLKVRLGPERR